MALSCKTLTQACLDYIDVPYLAQATASQKNWVLNSINGALQELWNAGPSHFKRRELSAIIHGATAVRFTVTANSATISGFVGWQAWMAGCSVRMDGDVFDNEMVNATTLLQPYQGATGGAVNGYVFGDAVTLDASVSSVFGCVRLADIRELVPSPSREAFNRANYWHEGDYGEAILSVQVRRKWTGQPHTYWVDTVYSAVAGATQPLIRLRVAPIPQQQYILKWDAEMNPPNVVLTDLDSDSMVFQLPGHNDELALMPFVLQRFSSCPWFKNNDARAEIARQFEQAKAAIYASRPQVKRARKLTPII